MTRKLFITVADEQGEIIAQGPCEMPDDCDEIYMASAVSSSHFLRCGLLTLNVGFSKDREKRAKSPR
jgi:hypothetical protein